MRNLSLAIAVLLCLLVSCPRSGSAQSALAPSAPAEISADLGACSALVTVTGSDTKPIYAAKISTRIQYGFMGVKKLDLEAFTGADGQVKLNKLPAALKKPMYIHISKGDKEQMVEFQPDVRCHATFDVQLH